MLIYSSTCQIYAIYFVLCMLRISLIYCGIYDTLLFCQIVPLHLPPGDTSTERNVHIDGQKEQIDAAKELVNEVISGVSSYRSTASFIDIQPLFVLVSFLKFNTVIKQWDCCYFRPFSVYILYYDRYLLCCIVFQFWKTKL